MADKIRHNNSITNGDFGFSGGFVTAISGYPIAGAGGGGGGGVYCGDNEYIQYKYGTSNTFTVTYKVKDVVDNFTENVSVLIDEQTYNKSSIDTMLSAKQDELVFAGYDDKIKTINGSGFGYVSDDKYQNDKINYNKTINYLSASVSSKQDQLIFEYDEYSKISAINGSALAGQGGTTYQAGTDLKIDNNVISVDTNGNPHNDTNTRNFVEGSWTVASGYNCHAEGAGTSALGYSVHAQGMWTCFSSSKWGDNQHTETDIYWADGAGATVEGYCNATTSCPMSGNEGESNYGPIHGGIIKVIGNGYIEHDQQPDPDAHTHTHHPSDALIIFRDGTISAFGDIYKNDKKFITEDNISSYNVTAQAGVEVSTAHDTTTNTTTFGISVTSTPVVTDTRLSGYNGIEAELDGNVSGLWNVGLTNGMLQTINGKQAQLTQTQLDNIDNIPNKLDSTAASQTYQPKGNYVSSTDISDMATQTWVGQQGYLTQATEKDWTNTIQEASSKAYNDATANANSLYQTKGDYVKNTDIGLDANNKVTAISGKELIITAHQSLTNYYTKDETSGAEQLAEAFANLPGGGITEVTHDTTLTGKGNSTQDLGVAWSALSSNTIDYSNSAFNLTNGTSVSSFDQISAAIDSKLNKTLSFNVGTGNTVVDDGKCVVIGNRSYVSGNSVAFCDDNTAKDNSLAFGWGSSAKLHSFAGGYHCSADTYSISLAHENIATGHSISIGHANTAYNYAGAIGRGLSIDGGEYGALVVGRWNNISSNALFVVGNGSASTGRSDVFVVKTNGTIQAGNLTNAGGGACFTQGAWTYADGAMCHAEAAGTSAIGYGIHAEGCWTVFSADSATPSNQETSNAAGVFVGGVCNATSSHDYGAATAHSGVLAVYGNGRRNGKDNYTRSDAYVLYRDGTVSAKQYKAEGYTQNNTYVEGSVPKSLPNSGDNTMVVQKMFVCTSDNDIIQHSNLANGEGCIFFRVG